MQIVTVNNGELRTDSIAIAEGTDIQHKNVMELVRTYLADLEEFGRVPFETRPFETSGGLQSREVATLNQEQATLLMTYMRNSDIVRTFKKALVRAFYEMAKTSPKFDIPKTLSGALYLAAEQAKTIDEQNALIADMQPKADIADRICVAEGTFCFRQAAKILGTKENVFRNWLIQNGWIYYLGGRMTAKAYQIQAGYIEEKVKIVATNTGEEKVIKEMSFTAKGLHRLAKHLNVKIEGEAA